MKIKQIGEEGKMWNKRKRARYANERETNTVKRENDRNSGELTRRRQGDKERKGNSWS
jgi:hypothetical protein